MSIFICNLTADQALIRLHVFSQDASAKDFWARKLFFL